MGLLLPASNCPAPASSVAAPAAAPSQVGSHPEASASSLVSPSPSSSCGTTPIPSPSGGLPTVLWLVFLLAALGVGLYAGRRTRPAPPISDIKLPDDLDKDWKLVGGGTESVATKERAQLVESCVDLADRLRDHQPALYTVLTRDLAAVGVTFRVPDGEPFDDRRHQAVGTEPTGDPAADMRVATTVRAGYTDHGTEVRVPDVIIYRAAGHGNAR